MRSVAKISPQFWTGQTGRAIRARGTEAQLVALYLITNHRATVLGIYYLPMDDMAHDIGLSLEDTSTAVHRLIDMGFCCFDDVSEYVWVYEMGFHQMGKRLKPNDNRVVALNHCYQALPDLPYLSDFYDKYGGAFHLVTRSNREEGSDSTLDVPSVNHESKEEREHA